MRAPWVLSFLCAQSPSEILSHSRAFRRQRTRERHLLSHRLQPPDRDLQIDQRERRELRDRSLEGRSPPAIDEHVAALEVLRLRRDSELAREAGDPVLARPDPVGAEVDRGPSRPRPCTSCRPHGLGPRAASLARRRCFSSRAARQAADSRTDDDHSGLSVGRHAFVCSLWGSQHARRQISSPSWRSSRQTGSRGSRR